MARVKKIQQSLNESLIKSNEVAKDEFAKILKTSKQLEKTDKREFRKIIGKDLLKQRFAQLYICGYYNTRQIATMLMISETTVKNLLRDETVREFIVSYQDSEKELIDSKIKSLRLKATETIQELLDSDDDKIRLAASQDILDRTGHKDKEDKNININVSYEQRLQELASGGGLDLSLIEMPDVSYEEVKDGEEG